MLSHLFWTVATSDAVLVFDGLVLAASLAVGFLPLVNLLPIVGRYLSTARLVAVLVASGMAFVLGFRTADERETLDKLRTTLATKQRDLDIAAKSATDANKRVDQLQNDANAQHQADADYIASLQARPLCSFTDGDVRDARGLRVVQGRSSGRTAGRP
ncbi:hypothetical protein [Bradyrhizobium sp. SZCCHNR2032]|uniref:hypothetical protein n=1 Tax=Bradyrhizobium sp. SZCCHNR2032 TaxID=3057384 RepID=UPI002916E710|nr:hypothetical protein [Bradyrhizobium sp. SZCCHNR2032]